MLNTSFQYYPTGFRVPLNQDTKRETAVDTVLLDILANYKKGNVSPFMFAFYDELVLTINRLIPDFIDFLDANDQNTKISQQAYEFLADTIAYINTGKRPVTINSRMSICASEVQSDTYENKFAAQRKTMLRNLLRVPAKDIVFAWLRHKDGVVDMLCTLQFIFATDFRK
jgi:hypothetical protein